MLLDVLQASLGKFFLYNSFFFGYYDCKDAKKDVYLYPQSQNN